jgi:hypothetical protein
MSTKAQSPKSPGGGSTRGLRFCILSGSAVATGPSKQYGLHHDSRIIEQIIREIGVAGSGVLKVDSIDQTNPFTYRIQDMVKVDKFTDINIHVEVPCRLAWPYGRINIVVVNQEWWYKSAWDWVLGPRTKGGADFIVFKSQYARAMFPEVDDTRARVISWRAGPEIQRGLSGLSAAGGSEKAFLYLIGASANKAAAAGILVSAWRSTWPPLRLFGSKAILQSLKAAFPGCGDRGVVLSDTYTSETERITAQAQHEFHVVASVAEGFGYTFAEAAALGALPLWTDIGVYSELYGDILGNVGKIRCTQVLKEGEFRDRPVIFDEAAVSVAVESLLALTDDQKKTLRGTLRHVSTTRMKDFRAGCRSLFKSVIKRMAEPEPDCLAPFPPRLPAVAEFPQVAVITLTHNRKRWFANMAQNILKSDYPPDKITWIIADDSTAGEKVGQDVANFQSVNPYIRVRYLPIVEKMPIGAKRNKACLAAPSEVSVFVMMDDDDHYPATSIRNRIGYLNKTGFSCVYCAILPMYDAAHYISAMNIPPLNISPAERVSEASLAFTRKFFEDRKFPASVSVAEGEGFLAGREEQTAEIPPQGVIVSFLHSGNSTSRRIPESNEPNGCHYGFSDEYFKYLSEIGGAVDSD